MFSRRCNVYLWQLFLYLESGFIHRRNSADIPIRLFAAKACLQLEDEIFIFSDLSISGHLDVILRQFGKHFHS
jgi:hypothetical protein